MVINIFRSINIKKDSGNILKDIWNEFSDYEEKRQYLQQLIMYVACDSKLFLSSISNDTDNYYPILNIGSGYCVWSREFVLKNNNYVVINIDINNFYKNDDILMFFKKINLKTEKLTFNNNRIYYVYQRDMISIYKDLEWNNIIEDIHRVLMCNGYFEFIEYDIGVYHEKNYERPISNIFFGFLTSMFKENGYIYDVEHIYDKIKNVFIDSELKHLKINLPLYNEENYNNICTENAILAFTHFRDKLGTILKTKYKIDFDQSLGILKNEWIQNKSYMRLHIIFGKKR